jgi:hypothetical protein
VNLSDDSDGKNEAELNPNGEDPANSDSASVIATPSIITENADDERTTNDNTKFEPSESVHGSDEISRPSSRTLLLGMNVQTKMEVIADETATSVNSDVVICPAPSTNQQHQTINHPMEMDTEKSVTPKPVESTSQPATKATSSTAAAAPLPMECNQTPPSSDLSHSLWVRNISTTTKAADLKVRVDSSVV